MKLLKLSLCFAVFYVGGIWSAEETTPAPPSTQPQEDADDEEEEAKPTLNLGNAEFNDPNWTPLPNMVAGVRGYNVLEGNPFKDSGDPGFVTQLFIPASLKDGKIELESGITANDLSACKRNMDATSIASMEGLSNFTEDITKSGFDLQIGTETEITAELSLSGDIKAAEGEASIGATRTIPPPFERAWGKSRELQEMSSIFSKDEKMLSISFGFCEQYEMIIDRGMTPPFTDMLKNGIKHLHSATDQDDNAKNEAFKIFIDDFGTHFMQEVKMGAEFMATTEYTKLARDKLSAKTLNDCSYKKGAKIYGVQVEENSDSCKNEDIQKLNEIGNENSKLSIITKGSRPTDIEDWATQDFTPVPLKFKLAPIVNLFLQRYFDEWEVKDKDKNVIKAEDLRKWFLKIYWSEEKFCAAMKIDCEKKVGCGLNDKCPVDTLCDRTASLSKQQTCSSWTDWKCTAKCGRGRAESRMRHCEGCIGTTYEEVERPCKGKRGCYSSTLSIEQPLSEPIKAIVAEIPKNFDQHFSVCVLFKTTSRTTESALFNLNSKSEGEDKSKPVLTVLLSPSPGGLKVVLHKTEFVFQDFKDVLTWQHICLVWKHHWSIYGEATLYVNGLFMETKFVGLRKTPSKKEAGALSGDIIIGGHKVIDTSAETPTETIESNFMGSISGLYIYNRILTPSDVDEAYRGYAPIKKEMFFWDDVMNPSVKIPDHASTVSEPINPMDVVSARTDHYYFDVDAVPYPVAQTKCELQGGELTSIDSPMQNDQLVEELKTRDIKQFWVGLSSSDGGTTWKWSNDEVLGAGHWSSWEDGAAPTGLVGSVCVTLDSSGKWKAETCTNRFAFACLLGEEKVGLKNPRLSTTDGAHSADKALDGDFNTFSKTLPSQNGIWRAELNRLALVTMVHIYALKDNGNPYTAFKAWTSMDDSSWTLCKQEQTSKLKNLFVLTCDEPILGKFIKIESTDGDQLKLFEVQVYGKLPKDMVHFPKPTSGVENGIPYQQGYVEIRHNGKWGTICDSGFTDNDYAATAVCKMMGFVNGKYAEDYKQEELATKRDLPVWLDDLSCSNGAESVVECLQRRWGDHDCREGSKPHQRDIGVRCYRSQQMEIKLANEFRGEEKNGQKFIQGPIQFKRNGHWQYMCGTLDKEPDTRGDRARPKTETLPLHPVTTSDANVFCKIMGHKSGELVEPVNVNNNIDRQKVATVHCAPGALSLRDCDIVFEDLPWKIYTVDQGGGRMMSSVQRVWYRYQHCQDPVDQTSIRCYV